MKKLAGLIGTNVSLINKLRAKMNVKPKASTSFDTGLRYVYLDSSNCTFAIRAVINSSKKTIASSKSLEVAVEISDWLSHCIENDMFNHERVEHPYFDKLDFAGR